MRVPNHVMGVKGDECQCGRRLSVRHCISCGSVRIYARMNRLHTFASGEQKWVDNQFRCQACGHLFVEVEREFCNAPPVNAALASQKMRALHDAKQQGEYLRPQDEAIANALQTLIQPSLKEDHKRTHDLLVYNLRTEYADRKASGEQLTVSMDDFVLGRLKELNAPCQSILYEPPKEHTSTIALSKVDEADTQPQERETISAEERGIRLEWSRKKLSGHKVPDCEDYVRRRLAGEIIE